MSQVGWFGKKGGKPGQCGFSGCIAWSLVVLKAFIGRPIGLPLVISPPHPIRYIPTSNRHVSHIPQAQNPYAQNPTPPHVLTFQKKKNPTTNERFVIALQFPYLCMYLAFQSYKSSSYPAFIPSSTKHNTSHLILSLPIIRSTSPFLRSLVFGSNLLTLLPDVPFSEKQKDRW